MNAGQVVGGVAVVGIAALTGLAITADDEPQTITTPTSVFTFDPTNIPTSTTTAPTESSASGTATTVDPTDSTDDATETSTATSGSTATTGTGSEVPSSSSSTTSAPTPPTSAVAVLPPEEHASVVVRVINGGGEAGAAAFVTGVLKTESFAPIEPTDAAQPVDATTVFFAAGAEQEAATVNALIGAEPERVIAGTETDPNWAQFGPFLDVLVVLGPS